ncbi:MAG: sugar transferase [Deltaproteobacteria bacterium]|nr:sugar transferase [Deltaproteobacteria bacterium]
MFLSKRFNILYSWTYCIIKRFIDLTLALLGLIFLIPLFMLTGILIKLDSPGPVFFAQKRCGKGEIKFNMFKFRSMINNAETVKPLLKNEVEGSVFKIENDPRITRVGKLLRRTSLDELPQLFNILIGNMSIVGPRPLADAEMEADNEWKKIRLSVKPGLTGLWQIKGRNTKRFADWVKYDTEYVKNRSLLLDLKIIFMTIGIVLKGKGSY